MRLPDFRNISFKLPAIILAMVAISVGVASGLAYFQQRDALEHAAEIRLQTLAEGRADDVETLFYNISQDLAIMAGRSSTLRAFNGFKRAWGIQSEEEIAQLRALYTDRNPFPEGERERLDEAGDISTWTRVHAQMHPEFRALRALYGYRDIYLIEPGGTVIYSVTKGQDFAANLAEARLSDTGLARAFRKALDAEQGVQVFEDFAAYGPAGGESSAFLAMPLYSKSGHRLGVIAYRLSTDMISALANAGDGLGETGEVYLVGSDGIARTSPRLDAETGAETGVPRQISNPAVSQALGGMSGITVLDSDTPQEARAAFLPLDVFGERWAVVARQAEREILASVMRLKMLLAASALAVIATFSVLGVLFAQTLTRPLWRLVSSMREIARGNFDLEVKDAGRRDEIGVIARTLEEIRQKLKHGREEEYENRFRGVAFESSSACIMMADADMNITSINPALRRVMEQYHEEFTRMYPDFDSESVIGMQMDFFHRESIRERIRELLRDPANLPYTANISISEARFRLTISMVTEEDGSPMGYVVEWNDVTRDFLNTAILNAIDASQVKIEFTKEGMFLSANDRFCRMMGEESSAFEGRHGGEIFQFDEKLASERGPVFERLQRGESVIGQFRLPRTKGGPAIVDGSFSPVMDAGGKLLRILMLGNDVTEARQAIEAADARRDFMRAAQQKVVDGLRRGLSALAEGDLTVRLEEEFAPDYEQLRQDFNRTCDRLLEAMRAVVENADLIRGEAGEIANAADDLSSRTERQAATLEETASALDQLTSSVRSAADGASLANELVQNARENAEISGKVVREAVEAMSEIEHSSKQISKITSVIDDIAFQTNLLALNAGVEAARAGEAGRGFAVVASEVRALAQRSSEAAREINELISASGMQVKRGVELVDQTGAALESIVSNVSEIDQKVSEIAVSAREQSSGLAEINEAVNQLDQVTQQNAAMFEQTTAASHALTREAENLNETTSRFRIDTHLGGEALANVVDLPRPAAQQAPETTTLSPATTDGSVVLAQEAEEIEEDWDDF